MLVSNAVKKLSKYGKVQSNNGQYWLERDGEVVSFLANGKDLPDNEIVCERVRSVTDVDDVMTDYSAGVYCDNLTQAIRIAGWE